MGAASYLLAGAGHEVTLESACHGAGRALSRERSARTTRDVFVRETASLRVVAPIDSRSPSLVRRRDILEKYEMRLMEEAPYAYKPVEPIVDSVEVAGIDASVLAYEPAVDERPSPKAVTPRRKLIPIAAPRIGGGVCVGLGGTF